MASKLEPSTVEVSRKNNRGEGTLIIEQGDVHIEISLSESAQLQLVQLVTGARINKRPLPSWTRVVKEIN